MSERARRRRGPLGDTAAGSSSDTGDNDQQRKSTAWARLAATKSGRDKPFEYGFTREVVAGDNVGVSGEHMWDVCYHTPDGLKLARLRNDQMPNTSLNGSLTEDSFPMDTKRNVLGAENSSLSQIVRRWSGLPLVPNDFTFLRTAISQPPTEVVLQAEKPSNSGETALPLKSLADSMLSEPRSYGTRSRHSSLLALSRQQLVAATEVPCDKGEDLSMRWSTEEPPIVAGGLQSDLSSGTPSTSSPPSDKRPRRAGSVDSADQDPDLPDDPKIVKAKIGTRNNLGSLADTPPTLRCTGRLHRKGLHSRDRLSPLVMNDHCQTLAEPGGELDEAVVSESEQGSMSSSPLPRNSRDDIRDMPEDNAEEFLTLEGRDNAQDMTPKRALVFLQDVFRAGVALESLFERNDSRVEESLERNSVPPAPAVLPDHSQPWQGTVAWEGCKLFNFSLQKNSITSMDDEGDSLPVQPDTILEAPWLLGRAETGNEDERNGLASDVWDSLTIHAESMLTAWTQSAEAGVETDTQRDDSFAGKFANENEEGGVGMEGATIADESMSRLGSFSVEMDGRNDPQQEHSPTCEPANKDAKDGCTMDLCEGHAIVQASISMPSVLSADAEVGSDAQHKQSLTRDSTDVDKEDEHVIDLCEGPSTAAESASILEPPPVAAEVESDGQQQQSPSSDSGVHGRIPGRWPSVTAEPNLTCSETPRPHCTVECPQARGQLPQLVCSRCLRHFHQVCIGLRDINIRPMKHGFVCEPCREALRNEAESSLKSPMQAVPLENKIRPIRRRLSATPVSATPVAKYGESTFRRILPRPEPRVEPSRAQSSDETRISFIAPSTYTFASSTSSPSVVMAVNDVRPRLATCATRAPVPALHLVPGGMGRKPQPLQFLHQPGQLTPTRPQVQPLPITGWAAPSIGVSSPALISSPTEALQTSYLTIPEPAPLDFAAVSPPECQLEVPQSLSIVPGWNNNTANENSSCINMSALMSLVAKRASQGIPELPNVQVRRAISISTTKTAPSTLKTAESTRQVGTSRVQVSQSFEATQQVTVPCLALPRTAAHRGVEVSQPAARNTRDIVTRQCTSESEMQPRQPRFEKASVPLPKILGKRRMPPASLPQTGCGLRSTKFKSTSAVPLHQTSGVVSVHTLEARRKHLVEENQESTQQQVPASKCTNSQPNVSFSSCVSMMQRMEPRTDSAGQWRTRDRTLLPHETCGRLAVSGNELRTPVKTMSSSGIDVVRATPVLASKGTANLSSPENSHSANCAELVRSSASRLDAENAAALILAPVGTTDNCLSGNFDSANCVQGVRGSGSGEFLQNTVNFAPGCASSPAGAAAWFRCAESKKPQRAETWSSAPLWVRPQRDLVHMNDKTSLDPSALHCDPVSWSPRSFFDLAMGTTALEKIFRLLPLPSLCRAAQVCKAWNIVANSPFLCKKIDFRHVRVLNWKVCIRKLHRVGPEDLILEGETVDHLRRYAGKLLTVKRVSLEVNPFQLAFVSSLFPALNSLQAVVSCQRGGPNNPGHGSEDPRDRRAPLGCLVDLMRIKGLERLELRGAHGLILRPFSKETVAAVIMENRLRVLSLTTAQGISQYFMELIGLLSRLEELALGNCTNWPAAFFTSIGKLKNLRRLALEGGEDGKGFSTMLLGLSRLERLELKRWTLSDSLCDVLPRMENLRTFLIWPRSTGPVALTNRNALRSCLSARNKMERLTWIVDYQHLVDRGSPTRGKSLALALKQLAPDVHIAIEPGRLCRCTPGVATAFFRRTPSAATSSALVALHNLCNATEPSNIQDNTARNSRVSDSCASSATNRTSYRASTSATPASLSSQMCDGVVGVNMGKSVAPSLVQPLDCSNTVLSSGNAPHQTTSSSKAASKSSAAAGACCAIAETLLGVWDISLEEKWHLTLQQLCEGLGHCMGPATSVSVGLRVEP